MPDQQLLDQIRLLVELGHQHGLGEAAAWIEQRYLTHRRARIRPEKLQEIYRDTFDQLGQIR